MVQIADWHYGTHDTTAYYTIACNVHMRAFWRHYCALKELCHGISVYLVTEAGWGSPIFNQECGRCSFVTFRSHHLLVPGRLVKVIGRVPQRNRLRDDTKQSKNYISFLCVAFLLAAIIRCPGLAQSIAMGVRGTWHAVASMTLTCITFCG